MSTSSKSLSSVQVEKRYGISQITLWFFIQKARIAMDRSKKHIQNILMSFATELIAHSLKDIYSII